MPTLRSDQPPVNAPKTVSTQVNSTRMPARPPSAIGARTPGMATGAPLPGTPTNPGLSADQPVPSIGATRPMATAQPAQKPPAKHKTGLEGLTPQASLQPGRRKQIIDIISKHAEHLPTNCVLTLVEKLVEKHAERALSGVTAVIKKAALKRLLKTGTDNYVAWQDEMNEQANIDRFNKLLKTFGEAGGKPMGDLSEGEWRAAYAKAMVDPYFEAIHKKHKLPQDMFFRVRNEKKEPAKSEQTKTAWSLAPILKPRVMREFVKRSNNKPKAAQLYVRLVKAATILNSKG